MAGCPPSFPEEDGQARAAERKKTPFPPSRIKQLGLQTWLIATQSNTACDTQKESVCGGHWAISLTSPVTRHLSPPGKPGCWENLQWAGVRERAQDGASGGSGHGWDLRKLRGLALTGSPQLGLCPGELATAAHLDLSQVKVRERLHFQGPP